jgi:hypothetical protein
MANQNDDQIRNIEVAAATVEECYNDVMPLLEKFSHQEITARLLEYFQFRSRTQMVRVASFSSLIHRFSKV